MKKEQLSDRFRKMKSANPNVGDYILLSAAIRGMHYNKSKVTQAFNAKVPVSDYSKSERDVLLENLWAVNVAEVSSKNTALLSQTESELSLMGKKKAKEVDTAVGEDKSVAREILVK